MKIIALNYIILILFANAIQASQSQYPLNLGYRYKFSSQEGCSISYYEPNSKRWIIAESFREDEWSFCERSNLEGGGRILNVMPIKMGAYLIDTSNGIWRGDIGMNQGGFLTSKNTNGSLGYVYGNKAFIFKYEGARNHIYISNDFGYTWRNVSWPYGKQSILSAVFTEFNDLIMIASAESADSSIIKKIITLNAENEVHAHWQIAELPNLEYDQLILSEDNGIFLTSLRYDGFYFKKHKNAQWFFYDTPEPVIAAYFGDDGCFYIIGMRTGDLYVKQNNEIWLKSTSGEFFSAKRGMPNLTQASYEFLTCLRISHEIQKKAKKEQSKVLRAECK